MGKTTLFNQLTKTYSLISNYPLTTYEINKETCFIDAVSYCFYDTPGLSSLYACSEEERLVRTCIFDEHPDIIIQCIDAHTIKQSLSLTLDLIGLRIPMILCIHSLDETRKNGQNIAVDRLSELLGIPLVVHTLQDSEGIQNLKKLLKNSTLPELSVRYPEYIENKIQAVEQQLPSHLYYKKKIAALILENDPSIGTYLQAHITQPLHDSLKASVSNQSSNSAHPVRADILSTHNNLIDTLYQESVTTNIPYDQNSHLSLFARLSRQPLWGSLILFLFLVILYYSVVYGAGFLTTILDVIIVQPGTTFITHTITNPWIQNLLIGHYGIISLGLFNALCTVLPILSIYFLLYGILEDSGYIPTICVLTNRILKKLGISGNSIMSVFLGLGCKTMATMTCKNIQSKKEKLIALFLIAFAVPCSAQWGLTIAILGLLDVKAFMFTFATLIFFGGLAGIVLNKIIKDDAPAYFIQQLPIIKIPLIKPLIQKTGFRLWWFIKEGLAIFVFSALILFILDQSGALHLIKHYSKPLVIQWLHLPVDIIDTLILTLARREAAGGMLYSLVDSATLSYTQSIVAIILTSFFVPCISNVVALCKQLTIPKGIALTLCINLISILIAGFVRIILEFFS